MYVIDKNDKIIFHPDHERIGEIIKNNTGLDYIKNKIQGKFVLSTVEVLIILLDSHM
jgi:hypothetical protein